MSSKQMKPGNGILFKNDKKETEAQPDYKGRTVRPDGVECWFAAWIKEGANGKYMTTSIGDPCDKVHQEGVQQARAAAGGGIGDDMDDDHPF